MGLDLKKLKGLREANGLSQADAAAKAGFQSKQHWQKIEGGTLTNITIQTLERMAFALGVDPCDVLAKPKKKGR